jgi:hypothetical protein
MDESKKTVSKPNWLLIFAIVLMLGTGGSIAYAFSTHSALSAQQAEALRLKMRAAHDEELRGGLPAYLEKVTFSCKISDTRLKTAVEETLTAFGAKPVDGYGYLAVTQKGDSLIAYYQGKRVHIQLPDKTTKGAYQASRYVALELGTYLAVVTNHEFRLSPATLQ